MANGGGDKRAVPRIQPFVAACRVIEAGRRFSGHVTDLSLAGAQVSCTVPPPSEGTAVVLEVRFGTRTSRRPLPARVQWARPAGNGHQFGVTFDGLDAPAREDLAEVIEEFRQLASRL